jgi:hypothetical protein
MYASWIVFRLSSELEHPKDESIVSLQTCARVLYLINCSTPTKEKNYEY